jgi:hypothetical protein
MLYEYWNNTSPGALRNLSKWDVSNVTTMEHFINNQHIRINDWDTSNVINMEYAFDGCTFDDDWNVYIDTSNVEDMSGMFCNATPFRRIDEFNTKNTTDMSYMFSNADINYRISLNWDTGKVTDMSYMFESCDFTRGDFSISNFDTSNVETMSHMFDSSHFAGYTAVNYEIDFSSWHTPKLKDTSYMFANFHADEYYMMIRGLDTSNVENMSYMFYNNQVSQLYIYDGLKLYNNIDATYMFSKCNAWLIAMGGSDVSEDAQLDGMFFGVTELTALSLTGCNGTTIRKIVDELIKNADNIENYVNVYCYKSDALQAYDDPDSIAKIVFRYQDE